MITTASEQIQFRVWDDFHQSKPKFWYSKQIGIGDFFKWVEQHPTPINNIQQWTGLKDRNGRKVFAGDIVKFKAANYHDNSVEEYSGPVTFDKGIFLFGKQEFATNDSNFMTHTLEVIGNIFENPELL